MIAQYIMIGDHKWNILVYYNVDLYGLTEVKEMLSRLDCPKRYMRKALDVLRNYNTGLTYSNNKYKMSIVCISRTTSEEQMMNSIAHEVKHVQSHICEYYDVEEDTEAAAYLTGYIIQKMHKAFKQLLK